MAKRHLSVLRHHARNANISGEILHRVLFPVRARIETAQMQRTKRGAKYPFVNPYLCDPYFPRSAHF